MPLFDGTNTGFDAGQIISSASNIRTGQNPSYTIDDFRRFFPNFSAVPDEIVNQFIEDSNAKLNIARWRTSWLTGMHMYVAHCCSTYQQMLKSSDPQSPKSSESVDVVSASYDTNTITQSLKDWGDFLSTSYGQRLATMAKFVSKGGMMIW